MKFVPMVAPVQGKEIKAFQRVEIKHVGFIAAIEHQAERYKGASACLYH